MAKKIKKLVLLIVAVMLFAFCGIFLTACGKPGDVSASSIVYDGETIKWGKAKNATGYVLTVDGKAYTLTTTEYAYKAKSSMKSVDVSVYAVGKGDKQGAKASKTFTRLETIRKEAITFSADGVMSWEEVEDADKYELEINGEIVSTASLEWDEFEFGKTNKIRIRPVTNNNSTFSSWSTSFSKTYLGVPTGITYDGVNLRWKGSNLASGYNIYIDGNLAFEGITGSSYGYDAEQQSFEVALQAVGENVENGNTFSSPVGEDVAFTFLPIITRDAMDVDSGVLTWEGVAEATAYQLEINGSVQSQVQKETSYEIPAGTQMRIRVKPVLQEGNVYFSDFSEEIDVYLLNAPSPEWNNFTLEDGESANVIDWSAVAGKVGGYTVKIVLPDGTEQYEEFGKDQREFPYAFVEAGKYQLSVKATAAEPDVYDSKFSTPFEITRLPSPTALATNSVTSDSTDLARGFTWTWQNVYGASGYQIYKEGNPVNALATDRAYSKTVTGVVDASVTEETEITYTVQSLGSVSDHTIFLPSITNPDKAVVLTQKITVQAMPRDLAFDGFYMTWTGTPNAQKYSIRHSGNSNPATATVAQYDMQTLNAGTYQLSVCSQGNGGAVLASNYTEQKTVERLQRPYDLKIGTRVEEGYLQWVGDNNAESYIITIRGGSEPIETKSSINVADKISTTGTALGVTAKANYLSADGTTYYLTSEESEVKTFKKLEAPKFNEALVQNGKLIWNVPGNAGKFTPSYQLAKGSGMTYDGYISGREKTLDKEEFPAGKYQLKVKAIGDSEEFINSDYSTTASFTILDTPDVKLGKTAYEWDAVSEAISYQVKVNNEIRKDIPANAGVNDKFSWTPDNFTEIGTYDVEIIAIGDGGRTLVDSYPYERTQETKRLSVPTIMLGYSEENNRYSDNGEVVVTVTQRVPFANGYGYIINDSKHEKGEDVLSFSMDPNTTGVIPVSVYAIGGQFDDAGVYRLNSPETSSPKAITLLQAPSSETIEVTTSLVKWAYIDGALGYEVEITFTGNVTKTITIENGSDAYVAKSKITSLGYTLNDIRKVRVSALGSKSANSVSSAFAERSFSS